jgi:hypothetical protein
MSPEQKKKISEAMTKLWKNKKFREKLIKKQAELGFRLPQKKKK